jgi:nucleoside-diphosphate-sugar epimerase
MQFHRNALLSLFVVSSASAFAPQQPNNARSTSSLSMSAALIVQNKGGGHGELGYQLAKALEANDKITSITILQDDACKDGQEPFKSYADDLPTVKIIKAPLSSDESMDKAALQAILGEGASFDYVWDNASKKPQGPGKAICDLSKDWGVKLFTYVSSAGMYTPASDGPFPMPEDTTPIKASSGNAQLDQYATDIGLPLVSFRPQYIYGPKANKNDYIDYYLDRLVRGLPIPIPGDGTQLVSLTCSQDVAAILTSPLNNEEAAVKQRFFNCGTDQLVSYDDVAYLCAAAAGIAKEDVTIEHFDHGLLGKGTFPFRPTNFYVAPNKVKELLGWAGAAHSLKDDLSWYYKGYVARGGAEKKMSLVKDWEIVVGCKTAFPEYTQSLYDKYDPVVIDMSEVNME